MRIGLSSPFDAGVPRSRNHKDVRCGSRAGGGFNILGCGGLAARPLGPYRYTCGFFADGLRETLVGLPEHLWPKARRKKQYLNSVLARAEIGSAYRAARKAAPGSRWRSRSRETRGRQG